MSNHHATHDQVSGRMWRMVDLLTRRSFTIIYAVAVCLSRCSILSRPDLFNGAKGSFQSPLDQVDSGSTERDPLLANDRSRGESGVFSQVFWCHQRHLKVVLDENTGDQLLVLVKCVGWRDLRKLSDDFGGLVDFKRYAKFFGVGGTEDFGFQSFVGVKGEKL